MKRIAAALTIFDAAEYDDLNVSETVRWLESCIVHLKAKHKKYAPSFTAGRYFHDPERVGPDEEEIRNPRPNDHSYGRDPFPPR